ESRHTDTGPAPKPSAGFRLIFSIRNNSRTRVRLLCCWPTALLFTCGGHNAVQAPRCPTGSVAQRHRNHIALLHSRAFSPYPSLLASAAMDAVPPVTSENTGTSPEADRAPDANAQAGGRGKAAIDAMRV